MKERPILFSAPMVRAILADRKTQTRRVIKPSWSRCLDLEDWDDRETARTTGPYQIGQRLWVRETHALVWPGEDAPEDERDNDVEYRADGDPQRAPGGWPEDQRTDPAAPRWRPSIHMPRWASRITLEVTDVRVERVQDITQPDIVREGLPGIPGSPQLGSFTEWIRLWDSLNGKRKGCAWADNPWVWCVSFRRVT